MSLDSPQRTAHGRHSIEAVLLFTGFIAATYGFGMYLFPAMVESIRLDIPFSYATLGTVSGIVQAGFMISALLAGLLTGFLPCGLVYAMLALAASSSSLWHGAATMGLFGLGVLLPMISVQVRRLHDRDLSGWWYLAAIVAGMIPFVGFLATIALFVMNVLKGTPGPNRFGRDPFGADTSADVFT